MQALDLDQDNTASGIWHLTSGRKSTSQQKCSSFHYCTALTPRSDMVAIKSWVPAWCCALVERRACQD